MNLGRVVTLTSCPVVVSLSSLYCLSRSHHANDLLDANVPHIVLNKNALVYIRAARSYKLIRPISNIWRECWGQISDRREIWKRQRRPKTCLTVDDDKQQQGSLSSCTDTMAEEDESESFMKLGKTNGDDYDVALADVTNEQQEGIYQDDVKANFDGDDEEMFGDEHMFSIVNAMKQGTTTLTGILSKSPKPKRKDLPAVPLLMPHRSSGMTEETVLATNEHRPESPIIPEARVLRVRVASRAHGALRADEAISDVERKSCSPGTSEAPTPPITIDSASQQVASSIRDNWRRTLGTESGRARNNKTVEPALSTDKSTNSVCDIRPLPRVTRNRSASPYSINRLETQAVLRSSSSDYGSVDLGNDNMSMLSSSDSASMCDELYRSRKRRKQARPTTEKKYIDLLQGKCVYKNGYIGVEKISERYKPFLTMR
jgi:hypothetical protein